MGLLSRIKQIGHLQSDLFANFAGGGWTGLVQIACIPLYIKFLGIEAYGLVGFYAVLTVMLQVLDLGLSPTMNREMARYSVQPEKAAEARDLVRTLEVGYWLVGVAIGGAIVAGSRLIATRWIKAGTLPVRTIQQAVIIMGLLAFLQWPISFYQGGLMGLRRQVLYNVSKISLVTATHGGAVLILWCVSRTTQAFFVWLAVTSAAQVILLAYFLWKSLPPAARAPRWDFKLVRSIWRFAAGMSGITISALILTQMDKIILSRLVSLKVFGYYTVAGMFGLGLIMIITAVVNTVFPRFSAMAAAHDEEALVRLYHSATQLLAVLIVPAGAVLSLFSYDVLLLWTRNAEVARNAAPIAAVLVVGTALNGLMHMPYHLQLAYGWTSIGLYINTCFVIAVPPAIWYLTSHYGPQGAASVWVGLNAIYMIVGVPLTHRRLLRHEMTRWFAEDVAPASVAALLVAGLGRAFIRTTMGAGGTLAAVLVLYLAALTAAALAAPRIRSRVLGELAKIRLSYA
jgi:O-antigen/teichoic acid export membrane protein